MKKLKKTITLAAIAATLALGAAAADGGIVDVDTKLNVRSSPSTSSAIKGSLWDGQVITLHEKNGNFWYAEYAPNTFGYVHTDYIDTLGLKTASVSVSWGSLNVREGASTSSKIKDSLNKGKEVLILGTYGDFYKILYNGNTVGYASKNYLTLKEASSARKAISLSVPSYKQLSYPSLRLPGSGESVATHGCAVTSLAMTESFRTGKSVTPKTVIASEKFTSSGALYWPGVYSYGGSDLAAIYQKLAAGKPVIVHAKKSSGTAHFAVIYSFSGGALNAGNFKILDPGSYTRKTLADLYSEYPVFVKTLCY
ncbi:MAG: hypothetical protein E7598_05450 [Ruminococcaceae bacterium]|nr:hypothetical protein [Oscillospiraceae bacterium]